MMSKIDNSFDNVFAKEAGATCSKCNNFTPAHGCQRKNSIVYCRNCFNANRLAASKETEVSLRPVDLGVTLSAPSGGGFYTNISLKDFKHVPGEWKISDGAEEQRLRNDLLTKCYEDVYSEEEIASLGKPLEQRRQEGKKQIGPALLMEIFGYQLQIGKEKGYTDGSWTDYLTNGEDLMPSLKRHLVGVESGELEYTEYDKHGNACPTKANHAYALFWNAAVEAMRVYNESKGKK